MSPTPRVAEVVNWSDLGEAVVTSVVAGVGLCLAFALMLLGYDKAADNYEVGRLTQAVLYGALALFGLLVTLGGVVLGLIAMTGN